MQNYLCHIVVLDERCKWVHNDPALWPMVKGSKVKKGQISNLLILQNLLFTTFFQLFPTSFSNFFQLFFDFFYFFSTFKLITRAFTWWSPHFGFGAQLGAFLFYVLWGWHIYQMKANKKGFHLVPIGKSRLESPDYKAPIR